VNHVLSTLRDVDLKQLDLVDPVTGEPIVAKTVDPKLLFKQNNKELMNMTLSLMKLVSVNTESLTISKNIG